MDNEDSQEFRVSSVNNTAEYASSAVVEQSTRGGTNELHGEAVWNHNDSALNAKAFFAASKGVSRNNQGYGAISGPVIIPKIYNGRNRTFFYFHYERWISPASNLSLVNVPTDAMRPETFPHSVRRLLIRPPACSFPAISFRLTCSMPRR